MTVVSGPTSEPLPLEARIIPVESAQEMRRALVRECAKADAIIMAAAVCDFRPVRVEKTKRQRSGMLRLMLEPTPDIIAGLPRKPGQVFVGFAVETNAVLASARRKFASKRLDLVFAQEAKQKGSPFGRTRVRAWLLERNRPIVDLGWPSKQVVAGVLLDKVERLWYGHSVLSRPKPTDRAIT